MDIDILMFYVSYALYSLSAFFALLVISIAVCDSFHDDEDDDTNNNKNTELLSKASFVIIVIIVALSLFLSACMMFIIFSNLISNTNWT